MGGNTYSSPEFDLEMKLRPNPENSKPDLGAYENSNGILVSINEEPFSVDKFELFQNYPNPFNPSTKIKYSLPEDSYVELKLFDVLGREVAMIVNNEQDQGFYEVEFNASQLASGVYLYKIQAGKYIKTRKMILMK